ncbi:MAG: hypothetical protein L6Q51_10160 [Cyclobacteriaceae bacterium]|nr:hypothetical protein [Cyclobacteriaceae bacterium]
MLRLLIGKKLLFLPTSTLRVKKDELIHVIERFPASTPDEAIQLLTLRNQYPFSQLLQALAARLSSEHGLQGHSMLLQEAAIHCTDRSVLKEIMTLKKSQIEVQVAEDTTETVPQETFHDFADEVVEDLEKLKHAKETFEALFGGDSTAKPPVIREVKPEKGKREPLKSKKQRIVELAKELSAGNTTEEPVAEKRAIKKTGKKAPPIDPLIESIKTSRKKIKPENEKAKEQLEIIDQFIKSKPVISPTPATSEDQPDMSESIRSGEFSDHIVSETLVEILLKQGKKDKAIEVLKKLIWKFPQKKTYFAARIDDLKK